MHWRYAWLSTRSRRPKSRRSGAALLLLLGACVYHPIHLGALDGDDSPADGAGTGDPGMGGDRGWGTAPSYGNELLLRGANEDYLVDVATRSDGSVAVSGHFTDELTIPSVETVAAVGFEDAFMILVAPNLAATNVVVLGGSGIDAGGAIAVDGDDNIVQVGVFSTLVDFPTLGPVASLGQEDVFVQKYGPDGIPLWTGVYGGQGADGVRGVAVDAAGNIYFAGAFSSDVSFGGQNRGSSGQQDAFIVSLSPAGDYRWDVTFGERFDDRASAIALEPGGDVLVAVEFQGSVDFGGGTKTADGVDVAIVRLAPESGAYRFDFGVRGRGDQRILDLAVDPLSGDIVACGGFDTATDFGGGSRRPGANFDAFVVAYGSTSEYRWDRVVGTNGVDFARGVALGPNGNVVVVGYVAGPVSFDGEPTVNTTGRDAFVWGLDADGGHRWRLLWGGVANDEAAATALDSAGNIYVAGHFNQDADFGGGLRTTADGQRDGFLVRLRDQ